MLAHRSPVSAIVGPGILCECLRHYGVLGAGRRLRVRWGKRLGRDDEGLSTRRSVLPAHRSVAPIFAGHHKMDADTRNFCTMIRNRSDENRRAMCLMSAPHPVMSPAFSLLRQELDSMIRVIYLLAVKDPHERSRLIKATLRGERWKVQTARGKFRDVTDREMVDLAQGLQGWTQSVYRFGCAFVHLSDFHNHLVQNPFRKLSRGTLLKIIKIN